MTEAATLIDDLTAVTTPREQAPGRFLLDVPDGWQQGRGAFGGLTLAALGRSMLLAEPEKDRLLRALNAEIAGPVLPGEAHIEVTEVRRGNGLSAYDAVLRQQGQGLVRASAVLARARSGGAARVLLPRPSPPSWQDVPEMRVERDAFGPTFARHIEFRPTGPLPFAGGTEPFAAGWVRFRRCTALGAAELVALADAFWPSAFSDIVAPRPVGTVAFAVQLFQPAAPLDPAAPLFYQGRILADQDGYMNEQRELWTADGQLVALNQQTIAWIR